MNRSVSFEQLGREADKANRTAATLTAYLGTLSVAQAGALLAVTVHKADWNNATIQLQTELTEIVQERAGELIAEALERIQANGLQATKDLQRAFELAAGGGPRPDSLDREPMVFDPAGAGMEGLQAGDPRGPAPEVPAAVAPPTPPESGNREAPLPGQAQSLQADGSAPYRTAYGALTREAQELLAWCLEHPGARFARTPARDVLVAGGYLASQGAGPNATWTLTDEGLALAGARA